MHLMDVEQVNTRGSKGLMDEKSFWLSVVYSDI